MLLAALFYNKVIELFICNDQYIIDHHFYRVLGSHEQNQIGDGMILAFWGTRIRSCPKSGPPSLQRPRDVSPVTQTRKLRC